MESQDKATVQMPAPPFRGATVDTCDTGHQAIAFAGTCPICRNVPPRHEQPCSEGRDFYAADLIRLLRAHFGGAGASR